MAGVTWVPAHPLLLPPNIQGHSPHCHWPKKADYETDTNSVMRNLQVCHEKQYRQEYGVVVWFFGCCVIYWKSKQVQFLIETFNC